MTFTKDASIPNYDEWQTFNTGHLYESCGQRGSFNCDFQVASSYDFSGKYWLSNGKRLDNITWISFSYPDLKDVMTVCGFSFNGLTYGSFRFNKFHRKKPIRYCLTNSLIFDHDRTDYLGHQFKEADQDINQTNIGYYFCEDDDITPENLKLGSYLSATKKCKIKTPRICSNETLRDVLNSVVIQREVENPVFTQYTYWNAQIWTGAIRYNKSHFIDDKWLFGSSLG